MTPRDQQCGGNWTIQRPTELTVLSSHTLMDINFIKISEVDLMHTFSTIIIIIIVIIRTSCCVSASAAEYVDLACLVDVNIRQTQIEFWSLQLNAVVSEEMRFSLWRKTSCSF